LSGTSYRIGIDIGGTFTDIVALSGDGQVRRMKLPSTPDDYSRAIRQGLGDLMAGEGIPPASVESVVHGTTVATNAILEGRGARTALLTTAGFRDVLELRRIRLPQLYDLTYERPADLVPRRRRFEVAERMGPRGEILQPLDIASAEAALDRVAASGAEALAIAFLHAYANPDHEERVADLARARLGPQVFICRSSDVLPEIREYERTSTTVINAYVGPVVHTYLSRLRDALDALGIAAPLRIMQSNGGVLGAEAVLNKPAFIVESGPAAGVIGGAALAARCGLPNVITIDMGGTTAKASMIEDGRVVKTSEYEVGAGINLSSQLTKGRGHALKLPVIDVSEIGAGGGSLARIDATGMLRVGPESAGAVPGPVCYGLGGEIVTLTDAMIALGYVNPHALAGGAVKLDAARSRAAMQAQIAGPLNRPLAEAAHGVFVIAAEIMTRAVKAVSTFRGRDPRGFRLIAFGGNGALMAAEIAAALQVREVVVPPLPGLFSAFGLLDARLEADVSRTLFRRAAAVDAGEMAAIFDRLTAQARATLLGEGCPEDRIRLRRTAELRYSGQAFELAVDVAAGALPPNIGLDLAEAFGQEHLRTYGHHAPGDPVDLMSLRITAWEDAPAGATSAPLRLLDDTRGGSRPAYFGRRHGLIDTPILGRHALANPVDGPAVIEEYDATTLVPPGWTARLDEWGNILLARA
jgi:N-methylhydantoinase A